MTKNNLKILHRKIFISLIILLVVGSVAFSPILENSFTNWDDPAQLLENRLVRELSARNLSKIFTTPVVSEYHPLVTAIFSLEYHLFGPNPFPYHLHSLIIHLINGWLVFFLFYRLSGKAPMALVGSLLFLVHPLQVQAVAWVSARKDLIFTFFFLLSLLSYLQYKDRSQRLFYFFSFLFFIAAIFSKTLAVTLPAVILLWLWIYRRPLLKKDCFSLLPFLAVSLAFGSLALSMQIVRGSGSAAHLDFSLENVTLLFRNLNFYLGRIVFPFNLSPVYLFPTIITIRSDPVWPSLLLILSLAIWFRKRGNNRNTILWGAGFFIITIFPVLRFIPFTGIEVTANRFIYLPSIGLFYLAGSGFCELLRSGADSKVRKTVVIAGTILVIIFLSWMSRERCPIWKNSRALWAEAVERQEESDLIYHMLADSHFRAGQYERTIELCDRAIKLNPAMAYSYLLKSKAQATLGFEEKASETYEQYENVLERLGVDKYKVSGQ